MQHIAKYDRSDRQLPAGRRATEAARPRRPGEQERIFTTRVGLKIPTSLTYDRWEKAGQHIFQVADSSAWCLGDWLVYGQDRYQTATRPESRPRASTTRHCATTPGWHGTSSCGVGARH